MFPRPSHGDGSHDRDSLEQEGDKRPYSPYLARLERGLKEALVEATGCLFRKEVLLGEAESQSSSAQAAPGDGLPKGGETSWMGSARVVENSRCCPLPVVRLREAPVSGAEGHILA